MVNQKRIKVEKGEYWDIVLIDGRDLRYRMKKFSDSAECDRYQVSYPPVGGVTLVLTYASRVGAINAIRRNVKEIEGLNNGV